MIKFNIISKDCPVCPFHSSLSPAATNKHRYLIIDDNLEEFTKMMMSPNGDKNWKLWMIWLSNYLICKKDNNVMNKNVDVSVIIVTTSR